MISAENLIETPECKRIFERWFSARFHFAPFTNIPLPLKMSIFYKMDWCFQIGVFKKFFNEIQFTMYRSYINDHSDIKPEQMMECFFVLEASDSFNTSLLLLFPNDKNSKC